MGPSSIGIGVEDKASGLAQLARNSRPSKLNFRSMNYSLGLIYTRGGFCSTPVYFVSFLKYILLPRYFSKDCMFVSDRPKCMRTLLCICRNYHHTGGNQILVPDTSSIHRSTTRCNHRMPCMHHSFAGPHRFVWKVAVIPAPRVLVPHQMCTNARRCR